MNPPLPGDDQFEHLTQHLSGSIQTMGHVDTQTMAADSSKLTWQLVRMKATASSKPGEAAGSSATPADPVLLNCDHGDPTMFETYWNVHKGEHVMVSRADDALSYFVEAKKRVEGTPWFVRAELDEAIRELHALVGNAVVTHDRLIVVGTGSTQLFQAALYALASTCPESDPQPCNNTGNNNNNPITSTAVVAQSPYYSAYPQIINYLQSKLFHWAGDSREYQPKRNEACIEMVTSPNNPCGGLREGLVNSEGSGGGIRLFQVHDMAYYWPTYTPITVALDHDVMLFTLSKCTGHAGLRIGWAIVKDPAVARKMAEFITVNTIGVSQDAQSRAAGILRAVVRGYINEGDIVIVTEADCVADGMNNSLLSVGFERFDVDVWGQGVVMEEMLARKKLFHWGKAVMESRWGRVRTALAGNQQFSLLEPSVPATCTFSDSAYSAYSAFIWLKCEDVEVDCQMVLKRSGIRARGGVFFGVSPQFARLSLLDREPAVDLLMKRLAALKY